MKIPLNKLDNKLVNFILFSEKTNEPTCLFYKQDPLKNNATLIYINVAFREVFEFKEKFLTHLNINQVEKIVKKSKNIIKEEYLLDENIFVVTYNSKDFVKQTNKSEKLEFFLLTDNLCNIKEIKVVKSIDDENSKLLYEKLKNTKNFTDFIQNKTILCAENTKSIINNVNKGIENFECYKFSISKSKAKKYSFILLNFGEQKAFLIYGENFIGEFGRNNSRLLKRIIDTIPVRVYWKDKELKYLGCNVRFAADLSLEKPEKIEGLTDRELLYSFIPSYEMNEDLRIIENGIPKLNYEEYTHFQDGKKIWLKRSKIPLFDENNQVIGILGMYQDITEQKNAEIELVKSEARFVELADFLPQVVFEMNSKGYITYVNKKAYELMKTQENLINRHFTEFLTDEHKKKAIENLEKISKGEPSKGNRYDFIDKEGKILPVIVYTAPIYEGTEFKGFRGIIVDIREDIKKKEELRRSEELFHFVFENMSYAACLFEIVRDQKNKAINLISVIANSMWRNLFDIEKNDDIKSKFYKEVGNIAKFLDLKYLLKIINNKKNTKYNLKNFVYKNKYISPVISILENNYVLIICNDVTEIEKMIRSIDEMKEMFRIITELSADAASYIVIDKNGKFKRKWFYMDTFEFLGYNEKEIDTFDKWLKIVHPDDKNKVVNSFNDIMKGKLVSEEFRVVSKDKKITVKICNTILPIKEKNSNKIIGLYSSIRNLDKIYRENKLQTLKKRFE